MVKKTALYQQHLQAGAKMVPFGGWDMPVHYGSQIVEHKAVREQAGIFDVSHMTVVDVIGEQSAPYLQWLLANDVAKLSAPGRALYSCMLNNQGGILDDLIVYYVAPKQYRLVVNAATREKDLAWMFEQAEAYSVTVQERQELCMLALQGPAAISIAEQLPIFADVANSLSTLKTFHHLQSGDLFIAATGYTGESGIEVILPAADAQQFWQQALDAGVQPCGLGARDTLRLEAGLNLYGNDMDETTSPLESNLAWTVAWAPEDRDFIGRASLEKQRQEGIKYKLVGVILQERGVLRSHQKVVQEDSQQGEVTSGTFSPSLNLSIGLVRVPTEWVGEVSVIIRDKKLKAKLTQPCFVKQGQAVSNDFA
ncbi:MAG TPA: glycine cleavage system aminomethyltransferase GcvT [Gammaproteobacteria bacterium]|nr:glycine cleavage system aminomethyltransferase GcvT [Gammaproteobacteria bacterium]